jgi:K+-sensing histidine kinase KdpD
LAENPYPIHDEEKRSAALKSALQGRLTEGTGVKKRLVILQEIAVKIDLAKTREEILDVIRLETRWLFKYHVCFLGVVNPARTHYVINTLSPVADSTELNFAHFALDEGMPGWVIKNHVSILEDISSGPAFSPAIEGKLNDLGIQSMLIVPMRTGEEIVGALAFGSVKRGLYTDEDAALALHLAMYLAVALKNVTAAENARKRITQIEIINQVSRRMSSMLQLDELVNVAASAIQKTFNYFDVTVFLVSDDRSHVVLEAHSGNFVDFLPHGYRQNMGEGIIGHVARSGEQILCNDVAKEERYLAYAYHNTKSELAIPIFVENEVIGVLNVEDTRLHAFDVTDAIVLATLCDQLGSAIKNAKLYDEIRKANMKLTELDKMKSEFLGIVSHDFRSPLSSIMLAGRALMKNEAVQELKRVKEYLHLIVNQASRLNQLAEDTLSMTKLESGHLSYLFKIVNLERLIQDAVTLVRFSSRHQFEYTLDPNVTFIKGDQPKLRQVLQNLTANAVKYSPRGGKVKIVVEDYSPEQILISVSDEGIGIPANQIDKLFHKFSRVESGESREIRGAGLGLWICHEVVTAHGGKIWIESVIDKGTTFKFTLNKAQQ